MKKLTFTLLAVLFSVACFAQDITSAVTARVNLADRARKAEKALVKTSPLQALAARQNPDNWQEISWNEFLKQNKRTQEVEICSVNIDAESNRQCQQLAGPDFKLPIRRGQGAFDYSSIVTNQKIIYIGENHNTANIIPEVATILKSVRQANPNARILLASEFLVWTPPFPLTEFNLMKQVYQENLPLLQDSYAHPEKYNADHMVHFQQAMQETRQWLQEGNEYVNELVLLKKAGTQTEQITAPEEYSRVFETADSLNMDQLALDDSIELEDPPVVKVGGSVVRVRQGERVDRSFQTSSFSLSDFIGVSSWGVRERNREWARRIKAVLPLYDIIIVYAGAGHINNTYSVDLPPMVGIKQYTSITLLSDNIMSEEDERWYEKREKLAQQNGLSQDEKVQQVSQKAVDLPMFPKEIFDEWVDHTQPFWLFSTQKEEDQTFQSMREFSGDAATEDYIKRYNAAFPVREENFLFISLPDK